MFYLERPPNPTLQPFIKSLWYCRAPALHHARERVLPNGSIQVLINLSRDYLTDCDASGTPILRQPRSIISGARARFEIIDTADLNHLMGIVFQPGGFAPLFHTRADLLFGQSIALDALWRDAHLLEALCSAPTPTQKLGRLESLLLQLLRRRDPARRSEIACHALHLFSNNRLSVEDTARSIGVSQRRLSQVFREEVGLSPKLWCRVQRFQAATRALHRGIDMPWAELALACGYYDQAHFANDFKAFSSIDPTTYSAQAHRWQNHIPLV